MAKQQTEEELNLRRKARRRLIGAVALTLAVVVILPMVLDSEPRPAGQDIDLRIPDPDKVGEFIPGEIVSEVANIPQPAASAVVSPPVAMSAVVAQVEPDQKPQDQAANKSDATAADSYAVQIGAYSNAGTAKQELEQLKKWGFKAYTEKAGSVVRVRVGPYTDREKVEKVRQLLEKHGLHPSIVSIK
ncbi:MAG: SPOR domain-containing protein [Nitrosomonadales bacterium]|nr:SPOR domain-containing protein [Nitrosomonadales bacterium]